VTDIMQTIAIVNEKGGTGKTTTSVCLSTALGRMGKSVLLVDLDGQAASSRWLGVEEDTSFADALWQGGTLMPIPDVAQGVSLAPGSGKLDSVAHDLRPTQGGQLRKLLCQVDGYDYAIIDCPPSLGNRLIGNALLAATHAIVPVETSILALDGLKILLTTFEDIRDGFGHEVQLAGVLACRYDARTKLSRFILEELRRALPGKVFKTVIRENVRVRECPASGQSIFEYAPDSRAAEDYMALAHEVADLPMMDPAFELGDIPGTADELAPDERLAVTDMRRQVDSLLQEFGPGGISRGFFDGGSNDAAPEAQDAPAAEVVAPPSDGPRQSEKEDILQELAATTPPAPAPSSESDTAGSRRFESVGLYDAPPLPEPSPSAPDVPDAAGNDAPPEHLVPAAPPPVVEEVAETRPAAASGEPIETEEHGEAEQAIDLPAEQPAAGSSPAGEDDYPALRAMLRTMSDGGSPAGEDEGDGDDSGDHGNRSKWRKLLGKLSA